MKPGQARTEQPIPAKRRRGSGRPFTRNDPRINKGGVPSEVRAFHNWMRESFAKFLQEGAEDGLTNGEHIIRTLIQKAKDGDMKAIEYVLDRMGGKPLQSVEVGAESSFNFLSEADRIQAMESVDRILQMQAEADAKRPGFAPAREIGANVPPVKAAFSQKTSRESETCAYDLSLFQTKKRRNVLTCRHGRPRHQCLTCSSIG